MKRKVSDASGVPISKDGIGGGQNENQIVVYQPNDTMHLDVRLENETVWLTQEQMALLFGRDQSVIARHVGNIFKEGELSRDSVYAKNAYTASDGKTYQVAFYNLDVVISVGYRVKSVQGTRFRQWATGVLREYLLRGYSVNSRLNQLEDKMDRRLAKHDDDIAELKDKVDFFVQTQTPPLQGVFYNGQLWDARARAVAHQRPEEVDQQALPRMDGIVPGHPVRGDSRQPRLLSHSPYPFQECRHRLGVWLLAERPFSRRQGKGDRRCEVLRFAMGSDHLLFMGVRGRA